MESCSVLLVEDDDLQRSLLEEIFKEKGFKVLSASTAEQALSLLKREGPCVVVTDVRLPGMDGLSLLEAVKRENPLLRGHSNYRLQQR